MSSSASRRSHRRALPVLCVALVVALFLGSPSGAQTTDERILWCREYAGGVGIPAIAPDGTLYASRGGVLYVIAPDGTSIARTVFRKHSLTVPVIGDQGMVYAMSDSVQNQVGYELTMANYLHAFDPGGTEAWRLQLLPADGVAGTNVFSNVVVLGSNGDLLASTWDSTLYAIRPDGVLRWRFKAPSVIQDLGVGPDGTISLAATDGVYGVGPDGKLLWQWRSERSLGGKLAIDGSGHIYITSRSSSSLSPAVLYALDSRGQLLGQVGLEESPWVYSPPVIDAEGNILFLEPATSVEAISVLHAVTRSGEPYWRYPLIADGGSDVIVGADETIYLVGQEGQRKILYALDAIGGRERWQLSFTNLVGGFTLSETGVLYLVQYYGASMYYLYAIQTDSPGLANSPWPMPRHDPRNTGRVSGPVTAVLEAAREGLPTACRLGPSYPNPFNAGTVIPFELPAAGSVELRVYDLLGQEVALLAKGWFAAGRHQVRWEPQGQGSAVYLCRLITSTSTSMRRLVMIR